MNETIIKTEKENLILFRNIIGLRIAETRANIEYWYLVTKKSKKNSQDRIDALNNRASNEKRLKKDLVFIKVVDGMLKK